MSVLNKYCQFHPNFLKNLSNKFSKEIYLKLLKNLNDCKNEIQFRSYISEIKFGSFLSCLTYDIKYEEKLLNKTPDWICNDAKNISIFEVYRLGKSSYDQEINDAFNKISENLNSVEIPLVISISATKNFISSDFISQKFTNDLLNWINTYPDANSINIIHNLCVKCLGENIETKKLITLFFNNVDHKPNKLIQFENNRPNEITSKLTKYNSIISSDIPYFICIEIDFMSGFHTSDIIEYFVGTSVEFIDYHKYISIKIENEYKGKFWTKLGEFYFNPQLSGLIILDNQKFNLILNPNKNQIIYSTKYSELLDKLKENCYVS